MQDLALNGLFLAYLLDGLVAGVAVATYPKRRWLPLGTRVAILHFALSLAGSICGEVARQILQMAAPAVACLALAAVTLKLMRDHVCEEKTEEEGAERLFAAALSIDALAAGAAMPELL